MRADTTQLGCSVHLLFFGFILLLVIGGAYQAYRFISEGERKDVVVSSMAAQSCREKFSAFKSNDYIRQVTLTGMEVNSAIREDLGKNPVIYDPWIEFLEDRFIMGGEWSIKRLFKGRDEEEETEPLGWRPQITVSGRAKVSGGSLKIMPRQIKLGKLDLPEILVYFIKKKRPDLFLVKIPPQIVEIHFSPGQVELLKDSTAAAS